MPDPVARLIIAIELGDDFEAAGAAFDIVTTHPSPARPVALSAHQVQRLADFLDVLIGKPRRCPDAG
jgi:hypothetical protein